MHSESRISNCMLYDNIHNPGNASQFSEILKSKVFLDHVSDTKISSLLMESVKVAFENNPHKSLGRRSGIVVSNDLSR